MAIDQTADYPVYDYEEPEVKEEEKEEKEENKKSKKKRKKGKGKGKNKNNKGPSINDVKFSIFLGSPCHCFIHATYQYWTTPLPLYSSV